jgi:hypothetical protein
MSLTKRLVPLAVALLALALVLAPRRAHACGSGSGIGGNGGSAIVATALVLGVGLVATDATFAIYDVAKAAGGKHASKGMAIAEVSVMAPQVLVAGLYMTSANVPKTTTGYVISAIPTAMFLHGLLTLITVDWDAEQRALPPDGSMLVHPYGTSAPTSEPPHLPAPEDRLRVSIAPTVIPGGTVENPTMIPALGAWGSF